VIAVVSTAVVSVGGGNVQHSHVVSVQPPGQPTALSAAGTTVVEVFYVYTWAQESACAGEPLGLFVM
jgi:hypothetical protein